MTARKKRKRKIYTATIYGLRDIDGGDYFYIGSTKYDPCDRLKDHLLNVVSGKHPNKHFQNKVRTIGTDNIAVDILQEVDECDRWTIERDWIRNTPNLVNRIHNGIEYEIKHKHVDVIFDYAEQHKLTTSKLVYAVTHYGVSDRSKRPEDQLLFNRLHELADTMLQLLMTKYRDYVIEEYGSSVVELWDYLELGKNG